MKATVWQGRSDLGVRNSGFKDCCCPILWYIWETFEKSVSLLQVPLYSFDWSLFSGLVMVACTFVSLLAASSGSGSASVLTLLWGTKDRQQRQMCFEGHHQIPVMPQAGAAGLCTHCIINFVISNSNSYHGRLMEITFTFCHVSGRMDFLRSLKTFHQT